MKYALHAMVARAVALAQPWLRLRHVRDLRMRFHSTETSFDIERVFRGLRDI